MKNGVYRVEVRIVGPMPDRPDRTLGRWPIRSNLKVGDAERVSREALSAIDAMDLLEDFVRTPEWSVSMLEDIAQIVREARPDIGADFGPDDHRAWKGH